MNGTVGQSAPESEASKDRRVGKVLESYGRIIQNMNGRGEWIVDSDLVPTISRAGAYIERLEGALLLIRDFPDMPANGGMTLSEAIATLQSFARGALGGKP